jgi:hypothetical protein
LAICLRNIDNFYHFLNECFRQIDVAHILSNIYWLDCQIDAVRYLPASKKPGEQHDAGECGALETILTL